MDTNQLSGSIPSSLYDSNLIELEAIRLNDNMLTGTIINDPKQLVQLESLGEFNVAKNQLIGTIPTEFGLLSNHLAFFDLSFNMISGTIPTELGQLNDLNTLILLKDQLTGTLPSEIGLLSKLLVLSIGLNLGLTGPIPPTLLNIPSLGTYVHALFYCCCISLYVPSLGEVPFVELGVERTGVRSRCRIRTGTYYVPRGRALLTLRPGKYI